MGTFHMSFMNSVTLILKIVLSATTCYLYDLEPSNFIKLTKKKFTESFMQKRFSEKNEGMRSPLKIADNVYVEKNLSTEAKLATLRIVFDEYQLDYNDLNFIL